MADPRPITASELLHELLREALPPDEEDEAPVDLDDLGSVLATTERQTKPSQPA